MTEHATDFDEWLADTWAETQGFTLMMVLLGLPEGRVELLRSAHLHVIGDDLDWRTLAAHLDGAGVHWDAVALYRAGREGLVADDIARSRLASLLKALQGDRGLIRESEFLNRDGLRLRLDDAV
ncbi:hypothetical protein [Paracoccus sp. (in: a-proteobacteria)]|uniref:hypothetical protein n=1 Tax=Paracoccus sp. TaxID=267 RepID=UPI00396C9F13